MAPQLENDSSLVEAILKARAVEPFTAPTDLKNRVSGLPQGAAFLSLLVTQSSCFTITGEELSREPVKESMQRSSALRPNRIG